MTGFSLPAPPTDHRIIERALVQGAEIALVRIAPKLTIKQAVAFLGLSAKFLYDLRRKAEGPPYYQFRRKVLYPLADLERWRDKHRFEA